MSEQIDWGKAPEGTTHANGAGVFMRENKSGSVSNFDNGKWVMTSFTVEDFNEGYIFKRQTTPSWSGEGLPPVGVVCRIITDNSAWWKYSGLIDGEDVTVCHSFKNSKGYDMVVVEACNGACLAVTVECVAPIRTPEQIAAEEREAAIKRACADIDKLVAAYNMSIDCSAAIRATIEALYDAGYRKP